MKLRKLFIKLTCLILVVLTIIYVPILSDNFSVRNNLDIIYNSFVGETQSEEIMIEIWNIDSFEGGKISKTAMLKNISNEFQKRMRGIYVYVRNINISECKNLILSGKLPDLFSCSYDTFNLIKDYVDPIDYDAKKLYSNFLLSAKVFDEVIGIPWCFGLYYLISTTKHLTNAGIDNIDNFLIINNALTLGRKNKKTTYSLSYASGSNIRAKNALMAYYDNGVDLISSLSFDNTKNFSQYDAYVNFLVENSTILLGSQKDVFRCVGRVQNGKLDDVLIEPLLKNTDLVQYIFMSSSGIAKKKQIFEFLDYLLAFESQKIVVNGGLMSVCKDFDFTQVYKDDIMCDITSESIEKLSIYSTIDNN